MNNVLLIHSLLIVSDVMISVLKHLHKTTDAFSTDDIFFLSHGKTVIITRSHENKKVKNARNHQLFCVFSYTKDVHKLQSHDKRSNIKKYSI